MRMVFEDESNLEVQVLPAVFRGVDLTNGVGVAWVRGMRGMTQVPGVVVGGGDGFLVCRSLPSSRLEWRAWS